jgi:hypothetical protein
MSSLRASNYIILDMFVKINAIICIREALKRKFTLISINLSHRLECQLKILVYQEQPGVLGHIFFDFRDSMRAPFTLVILR